MLYLVKILFKDEGKFFFRHKQADRSHHQFHTRQADKFHTRNVEGNNLGRRKLIPDGNLNLHKGVKSTGNGKYLGPHKKTFS